MPTRGVVGGQKVDAVKSERARELRQRMPQEEKLLWDRLRGNALGFRFRRQQVIDGFIADFYAAAPGIVVEVDGPVHLRQTDYDHERDLIIEGRGLQIIRLTNEEIRRDIEGALEKIALACMQRQQADTPETTPSANKQAIH